MAREFCVGRKKKKKVSFGRRVQHDEREREKFIVIKPTGIVTKIENDTSYSIPFVVVFH